MHAHEDKGPGAMRRPEGDSLLSISCRDRLSTSQVRGALKQQKQWPTTTMHGQMFHSRTQLMLVLGKSLSGTVSDDFPPTTRVFREPNPAYVQMRLFINSE